MSIEGLICLCTVTRSRHVYCFTHEQEKKFVHPYRRLQENCPCTSEQIFARQIKKTRKSGLYLFFVQFPCFSDSSPPLFPVTYQRSPQQINQSSRVFTKQFHWPSYHYMRQSSVDSESRWYLHLFNFKWTYLPASLQEAAKPVCSSFNTIPCLLFFAFDSEWDFLRWSKKYEQANSQPLNLRQLSGFTTVQMRCSIFWNVVRRRLVTGYGRFGENISSKVKNFQKNWTAWSLNIGLICCSEKSVSNYHPKQRNIREQQGASTIYVLTALYHCSTKQIISCHLRD